MDSEEKPFLVNDEVFDTKEDGFDGFDSFELDSRAQSQNCLARKILWALFLAINLAVMVAALHSCAMTTYSIVRIRSYCPVEPFALSGNSVRYEKRNLTAGGNDTYKGDMTPELKSAWDQLVLQDEFFRATEEELRSAGVWHEDAIQLEHGGYMAGLGVMRELHCLDWIKQSYSQSDRDSTNRSSHEIWHLDHCLHVLRESMICRPDLTVGFYYWDSDEHPHNRATSKSWWEQTCVEWNSVKEWLKPRRIGFRDGKWEGKISPEGLVSYGPDGLIVEPLAGRL